MVSYSFLNIVICIHLFCLVFSNMLAVSSLLNNSQTGAFTWYHKHFRGNVPAGLPVMDDFIKWIQKGTELCFFYFDFALFKLIFDCHFKMNCLVSSLILPLPSQPFLYKLHLLVSTIIYESPSDRTLYKDRQQERQLLHASVSHNAFQFGKRAPLNYIQYL